MQFFTGKYYTMLNYFCRNMSYCSAAYLYLLLKNPRIIVHFAPAYRPQNERHNLTKKS